MASEPESPKSNAEGQELNSEFELRKAELALKAEELRHRMKVERRSIWFPLVVTVCSAIFAALGAGAGFVAQGYLNYQLEQKKFESALIQKALENNDKIERAKNVQFLIDIGLVKNLDTKKIEEIAKSSEGLPSGIQAKIDSLPVPNNVLPCGR